MAKNDINLPAVTTALGSGQTPEQALLAKLLLEDLQKKRALEEESDRQARVSREQNVAIVKEGLAKKALEQESCPHRKPAPSNESAIAGQRDHRGNVIFICQYCQQQWNQRTLPPALRIPADFVGGPNF